MPMFFFYFNSDKNNCRKQNEAVTCLQNRQDVLEIEARLVVLRLLQLRDSGNTPVKSVKQNNIELPVIKELRTIDLSEISIEKINDLTNVLGYSFTCRIPNRGKIFSKVNIEVNEKKYGIRCFDHTERPLINHSTRDKYEKLCKKTNVDINKLDSAIDTYWENREAGVFNEDCIYTSPLNPFLEIKEDLRRLLTYIAFHTYDITKDTDDDSFEIETLDGYIDYVNACDEKTWDVLNESLFFDKIWKHLRFSFRADRGMPHRGLIPPKNKSILKWTRKWQNRHGATVYKGALHIRISRYDTAINDTPFEELFTIKHAEEIREVSINQGDKDEYLIKLFLIDCRNNKIPIPLGDNIQIVESLKNSKSEEIGNPDKIMNWNTISPGLLVYICNKINAGKGGALYKADVFVNDIGISIKSQRGAPPSIINHTARDKILRVMKAINMPIQPLDQIVNRYWFLRLNGGTEDVSGLSPLNPFTTNEDGSSNMPILKPLLNYFTFNGTGTRDSLAQAKYVLSAGKPDDITTWVYYNEENFVDSVWENLVFSLRAKQLPDLITDEIEPWVKEIDGKKKGTLSVRVKCGKKRGNKN